jgi:hypothetical protein
MTTTDKIGDKKNGWKRGKYDGDTQVSGINSKSKQVTCYKIKNIVRGRV